MKRVIKKISYIWHEAWCYWWGFSHIREFYYKAKHLLWDRYDLMRTGLPKTQYCDAPERLLYGIMNVIVEHVEIEKCFEHTDYDNNGEAWKKTGESIREVYDWWKDYPKRQEEITIALNNWHDTAFHNLPDNFGGLAYMHNKKQDTNEVKRYSDLHDELDKRLAEEAQTMLLKVIELRDFLWT